MLLFFCMNTTAEFSKSGLEMYERTNLRNSPGETYTISNHACASRSIQGIFLALYCMVKICVLK